MTDKSHLFKSMALILPLAAAIQAEGRTLHYAMDHSLLGNPGHVKLVISPDESGHRNLMDVLFVIDSSATMSDKQNKLMNEIPRLVSKLTMAADINAAVTTSGDDDFSPPAPAPFPFPTPTPPPHSFPRLATTPLLGQFVGEPAVINSKSSTFTSDLATRIVVGVNGSGTERFFEPTIAALSAPLSKGPNANFMRKDAILSVVFVTDAEDQSKMTTDEFISQLDSIKGRGNYSIMGFIIPSTEIGCNRNGEDIPLKIEEALKKTGGKEVSLCGDWSSAIEVATDDMKRTLQKTVRLPFAPILQSIRLSYGTAVLPIGDLHHGWSYDSVTNSVVLGDLIDFSALPAADLVVEFDQY